MKRAALILIVLAVMATTGAAVYALVTFARNSNHARACDTYRTLLKTAWSPGHGNIERDKAAGSPKAIEKLDKLDREKLEEGAKVWNERVAATKAKNAGGHLFPEEVRVFNDVWDQFYEGSKDEALTRKGC